eukprot:1275048-Pleurochrysis_carterae.AAC.1
MLDFGVQPVVSIQADSLGLKRAVAHDVVLSLLLHIKEENYYKSERVAAVFRYNGNPTGKAMGIIYKAGPAAARARNARQHKKV